MPPPHILNVQSFRLFDRVKFANFLRRLRRNQIRAVRVGKESNEYGHVRSYRLQGRDNALVAYNLAYTCGLCEWLA